MRIRKPILYFEDAIGVTATYRDLFNRVSNRLAEPVSLYRLHSKRELLLWRGNRKQPGYRLESANIAKVQDSVVRLLREYEPTLVVTSDPATLGLLVAYREESWDWATIENLRGGVYRFWGVPWLVTYPMTAYFHEVRERDIALANDGFASEEMFADYQQQAAQSTADHDVSAVEIETGIGVEEDGELEFGEAATIEGDAADNSEGLDGFESEGKSGDSHFYTPILTRVSVGKFCLTSDWHKAFRILESEQQRIAAYDADGAAD